LIAKRNLIRRETEMAKFKIKAKGRYSRFQIEAIKRAYEN
jgi:hypothetical protein